MLGVLRIFFGAQVASPWGVLACLLLAGFFEAIGLATVLPILITLIGGDEAAASPLNVMVIDALDFVGLAPDLGLLLSIMVAGFALKCLLSMLAMTYVGYAVAEVATGLRARLIKGLLNVNWEYFTRQPVGRIANAVSVDATRAANAYLVAATFLANSMQTAVYALVAFFVSWKLALAALVLGAAISLSLHVLIRVARKAGLRQVQRTSELVTYLSDALGNIKPLKAMAKQAKFSNLFDKKIGQLRRSLRRQVISRFGLRYSQELLLAFCIAIFIYAATTFGQIPISELMVMGLLLFQTVSSVGRIQKQFQQVAVFESPYWFLQKLIAETDSAREPNPGTAAPALAEGCRFEAVSFAHDDRPVLEQMTLDIPSNQLTVITGPSGVGKTTLTDLLLGLYQPSSGEIRIDGTPLAEIDLQQWRDVVGYVPQELILFHDTILANVTLGDPRLGEAEAETALRAAGAWDFISALPDGLMSEVGEKGTKLSGGQRQRIALARALAGKPRLLILDEVTSALDPKSEQEICRNIMDLSGGITVLAITHREAWTEAADHLYRLDQHGLSRLPGGSPLKQPA